MLAGFAHRGIENRPERFQVLTWQNVGECRRRREQIGLIRRLVASIGCPRWRYGNVRRFRFPLNELPRQFLEFLGGEMMAVSREDRDRGVKSVRFAIRVLDREETLLSELFRVLSRKMTLEGDQVIRDREQLLLVPGVTREVIRHAYRFDGGSGPFLVRKKPRERPG